MQSNLHILFILPLFILVGCQSTSNKAYSVEKFDAPCELDHIAMSKDKNKKPIIRIDPKYPREAARKKLNGYVKMLFDITAEGVPANIHVIESYPNNVFVKESVKALKKWRYTPTERKCLPLRLDFQMIKH